MLSIVTQMYLQKRKVIKETVPDNFTEKDRLMRFLVIFIHL